MDPLTVLNECGMSLMIVTRFNGDKFTMYKLEAVGIYPETGIPFREVVDQEGMFSDIAHILSVKVKNNPARTGTPEIIGTMQLPPLEE